LVYRWPPGYDSRRSCARVPWPVVGPVRSGRRTLALELACESERIEEQNARRRVMMVVRQRVRQFISQGRSPVAHKPEIKNYENQRRGTQIRI
jgi:hypothetical protein